MSKHTDSIKEKPKSKIKFKIIQPKKELIEINNDDEYINQYIDQLSDIEKITLKIAEKQLESSFDIKKSIGFIEWINNKK